MNRNPLDMLFRSRRHLVAGLAIVGFAGVLAGTTPVSAVAQKDGPPQTTRTYQASDAVIANPERGFYHHSETHYRADSSGYVPLNAATLRGYRSEGISQILRVFYLEKFVGTDTIDQAYLDLVSADFDTARSAGVSVIVRFAYAQGGAWPYNPPFNDAPASRAVAHIAQLAPVLRAGSDVIATVQSGFVGLWGEGYYTDHYAADPLQPGNITEANWADRRAIVKALLDAMPGVTVQVRTMWMKQMIFGTTSGTAGALTEAQAFTGSDISRVGHHNDCFLAAPDDWGTFLTDPLSLDQDYLAQDSKFVPVGGETCNVNPPRSEWPSASAEMAKYHYSYLNTDYNRLVLSSWDEGETVAKRLLGYRLALKTGTFGIRAATHRSFPVSLAIENSGWAAPYNARPVNLVLDSPQGTYTVLLDEDPRTWTAGTTTRVEASVCAAVPAGIYDLYLSLPSGNDSLAGNPDYAIQLANTGTWDAQHGWNDLQQTVRVTSAGDHAGASGCAENSLRPFKAVRD
jgi:hypothetical protein